MALTSSSRVMSAWMEYACGYFFLTLYKQSFWISLRINRAPSLSSALQIPDANPLPPPPVTSIFLSFRSIILHLYHTIFFKSFTGTHPFYDLFLNYFFGSGFLKGPFDDFLFVFLRADAHPVEITKYDVPGVDTHVSERDPAPLIDDFPTPLLILGIRPIGTCGESGLQYSGGIPGVSVHPGACCSQTPGATRHDLTPQRVIR